jgi:hypothetical protein
MQCWSERPVRLPKVASPDRRAGTRFPLAIEVRYALLGCREQRKTGSGQMIDLSSSGLSFTADRPLLTGQKIEVAIDWPVLLDGGVRLQLVMWGVVVRTSATTAALKIQRHEFKTRGDSRTIHVVGSASERSVKPSSRLI